MSAPEVKPIAFGRQVCGDLIASSSREWLVADGLGGYAMGTVAGLRTRRYHGLLVVAGDHPGSRRVGLAALDPVVVIGDRRVRLATHEWVSGAIDPIGYEHLERFDLVDGIPRWRWSFGGTVLEREVTMLHGRSLVVVRHRLLAADRPLRVELTPLCTWRDAHGDRFGSVDPEVVATSDGFVFEHAYRVAGPGWSPSGEWFRGAALREEATRGLGSTEDLWAAGRFLATLAVGESVDVMAHAAPFDGVRPDPTAIIDNARARARAIVATAAPSDHIDAQLVLAADQFVVTTGTGPSVVAGYPWFGEWSRDTMTSYEGLFLDTNRADVGRALLERSAATLSEGMLANTADAGGLEYNTADATLWFVHAVGRHVERTGDDDLADSLAPVFEQVIEHHVGGTRFNLAADRNDGLLRHGASGWALTWMDARVGTDVITPRGGKAVEINALWINALGTIAALAARTGRPVRWSTLERDARVSFESRFVRADGAGLFDVVDGPFDGPDQAPGNGLEAAGDRIDGAVRPNQLLALSLPFGPGGPPSIVATCRRELLTSIGLRSLSADDGSYRGRHRGDVYERDSAYHQGTVWPWLIGPYVDACVRVGDPVAGALDALESHLSEWGLGSVSETADGDPPHAATGCPFQAWSVAELLRARRVMARRSSSKVGPQVDAAEVDRA